MTAATRNALHPGRWTTGPTGATASFRVRDVLHRPVTGTLPVLAAWVEVGPDGLPQRVRAELDLAGVDTGNARRDKDLRGRRFFDLDGAGQTVLVFEGHDAKGTEDGWTLPGELVLRDARCPVVLQVERTGPRSVRATAQLDRRDLGLRAPRLLVGLVVALTVEAELAAPA